MNSIAPPSNGLTSKWQIETDRSAPILKVCRQPASVIAIWSKERAAAADELAVRT
jgi:hypothetical protein